MNRLLAAVVTVLGCVAASAQESAVLLAPVVRDGDRWISASEFHIDLNLRYTDMDEHLREQTLTGSARARVRREFAKTVDGKPARVRLTYAEHRVGQGTRIGGPETERPGTLDGREFIVERRGLADLVTPVNAPEDPELTRGISLHDEVAALLPQSPVKAGDTWEVAPKDVARFLFGGRPIAPSDGIVICRLREVSVDDGVRVAHIPVDMRLKRLGLQEYTLEASLSGEVLFDVDRGVPLSVSLAGTTKVAGRERDEKDRDRVLLELAGEGNVSLEVRYRAEAGK
jgi:hypothetical protein